MSRIRIYILPKERFMATKLDLYITSTIRRHVDSKDGNAQNNTFRPLKLVIENHVCAVVYSDLE